MLSQKKSILARLLSNENIDIRHGRYDTAAFDVVNRVLFLPLWDNISEELYDLLTGHEVGHALYTPADGWHESTRQFDFPRSFVNIIEDIRIERMIQDRYPGLRRSFVSGYKELNEKDFFGLTSRPVESLSFMDRLNVKSKLRTLVDIDFTEEESYYFDLAYTPETFDDVLSVCQKIYEWLNTKDNEECPLPPQNEENQYDSFEESTDGFGSNEKGDTSNEEMEDGESSDVSEEKGEEGKGQSVEEMESSAASSEKTEEAASEQSSVDAAVSDPTPTVNEMETYTDDMFRQNESSLVERDRRGNTYEVSHGIDGYKLDDLIVDYKKVMESRRVNLETVVLEGSHAIQNFNDFISQADKVTNVMAREFDMRKRASQLMRAKEAKTGKLDMNKLTMYKFTDNIFLSNTEIPNAKSHGIVAIIDFSGSMSSVIQNVVDQAITLAMFCRKANIPFDIYSFTSAHRDELIRTRTAGLNQMNLDTTMIVHQLSSKMKKSEFNEAVRLMYLGIAYRRWFHKGYDSLGSTPLDSTLVVMNSLLDRFKAVNKLQKVTFMTITDGDSHPIEFNEYAPYGTSTKVKVDNTYFSTGRYSTITSKLLSYIQKKGYNTIGYFICDTSRDLKYQTKWYMSDHREAAKEQMKYYRKNGFVETEKVGYDRFFILNGRIDAIDDDFEVKEEAKANEIKTAFKKYATSKKSKRVFASQFAEAVA